MEKITDFFINCILFILSMIIAVFPTVKIKQISGNSNFDSVKAVYAVSTVLFFLLFKIAINHFLKKKQK